MIGLKERLATHLLTAAGQKDTQKLRILIGDKDQRLAQKLHKDYISDKDWSRYHAFLIDMDRLLAKHGGQPMQVMQQGGVAVPPKTQVPAEADEDDDS